jgi:hypothetical protein
MLKSIMNLKNLHFSRIFEKESASKYLVKICLSRGVREKELIILKTICEV